MASKLGSKQQADQEFDPKYEWQENAANYLLRVHLSGFRKEDFRVQVDGAGRLTVRGQRADGGKHVRFHKVFQLPPTSNLDDINGRFDAGVLNLTVPKRPALPPPATKQDMIRKPTEQDNEAKPKEEKAENKKSKDEAKKEEQHKEAEIKKPEQHKEAETKKPEESAKTKAEQRKEERQDEGRAELRKEETQKPKEEARKKAADEKVMEAKSEQEQKSALTKEEAKPKAEGPTETKPPQAADKAVDRESLLERVRRRAEEERAKAAEEAERQRKQSACGGWKERVAEELQGLKSSEWVETVKKNKEVIAAAVAAFSVGLFVSSRLFSRN